MDASEKVTTDNVMFDVKPPKPTKEGEFPIYEQCHRCLKWFNAGQWHYADYFPYGITPSYGQYSNGLTHQNKIGDYIGFTCEVCSETRCPLDDCFCAGPVYYCTLCDKRIRGFEHMHAEDICKECFNTFGVCRHIVDLLTKQKIKTFDEFVMTLDELVRILNTE